MVREGIIPDEGGLENDHIAFRTLGVPHLGIASLEQVFLHYGYAAARPLRLPARRS